MSKIESGWIVDVLELEGDRYEAEQSFYTDDLTTARTLADTIALGIASVTGIPAHVVRVRPAEVEIVHE